MFHPTFSADGLYGRDRRLGFKKGARRNRRPRRDNGFTHVAAEILRLEDRCMLTTLPLPPNQFPPDQVAAAVPLSDIIWNGGQALPGAPGMPGNPSIPSPSTDGAMKTVTLTNNGPATIYPFIRGPNTGQDTASKTGNTFYDPQDPVEAQYSKPDGTGVSRVHWLSNHRRHVHGPAIKSVDHISGAASLVGWRQRLHRHRPRQPDVKHPYGVYSYSSTAKISIAGTMPSGTSR